MYWHEENLSTISDPPQTAVWFSQAERDQERSQGPEQTPTQGTRPSHPGLTLESCMMARSGRSLDLPRAVRLRRGADFRRLRDTGNREAMGCLIFNWKPAPGTARSRVGVIAGRRLGPAVVRNRAKRLLREVFRLHQHELREPLDAVFVARPSIVGKDLHQVTQDMLKVFRRARLLRT
jgi:ribonuclease P protein component